MKRVFLFTTTYPYGNGETFIDNELKVLADNFEHIYLVPLVKAEKPNIRTLPDNVTAFPPVINATLNQKFTILVKGFFAMKETRMILEEFFKRKVFFKKKWILNWLSYSCLMRAALCSTVFKDVMTLSTNNDIFYFYWADNFANIVPSIKRNRLNKILVRFHGTDIYEELKGGYLPYRPNLLQNIDLALFISDNGKQYIRNRYPEFTGQQIVCPLGVFDHGISKANEKNILYIVSCSALNQIKRVHIIPQALRGLSCKAHWVHFGDGPEIDKVLEQTKLLPDHITFELKGYVKNENIYEYYFNNPIDLFINVSSTEGIPVSIMEAMSMGIPVIATNVGGVSEIVSNNAGFLIPSESPTEHLRACISRYSICQNKSSYRKAARKQWDTFFNAAKNYSLLCQTINNL